MTTHPPEAQHAPINPDLLEQIRFAIAHAHQPGRCRFCGDDANPNNRHYEQVEGTTRYASYRLCNRCQQCPDDTGCCSECGRYDQVADIFAPAIVLCPACLTVNRGLEPGDVIEGEGALW